MCLDGGDGFDLDFLEVLAGRVMGRARIVGREAGPMQAGIVNVFDRMTSWCFVRDAKGDPSPRPSPRGRGSNEKAQTRGARVGFGKLAQFNA